MNVPTNGRKLGALLAVVGLVGLVLTLVLPSIGVNMFGAEGVPPSPSPTAPTPSACATPSVVYYANQAPAGSRNFGPTQTTHSAEVAYQRLLTKMSACTNGKATGDPLFTATTVAFQKSGVNLDPATVEAQGNSYANNSKSWATAVKDFQAQVVSYTTKYDPHEYRTLGMVPNGTSQPSLIASSQKEPVGWALFVTFKDGTVREFRISCDIQPVAPEFPRLTQPGPTTPKPQPHPTPTHSTSHPKPTPTPTPTTSHPKPHKSCEDVLGPGYLGTYPNCRKSAVDSSGSPLVPTPPASAPGTNPAPVPVPTTGSNGSPTTQPTSSQCYDPTTGFPVSPGTPGAWCS